MSPTPDRKTFRDSAVLVMIRGAGSDLEVYWVRRSDTMSVQPGFWAFPGGKVDAVDAEVDLPGVTDELERAARACAVREAHEETGVRLDPAALAFAGRWQTPPFAPVRFDTLFFLARVPEGQDPVVVPGELAAGEWVRPADALARWQRGDVTFVAPILWTMRALQEGEDALAERMTSAPERARTPARRIEFQGGIVLHAMRTKPLPPAQHTNAYFLGEREVALVDPGSGEPGELDELFAVADLLAAEGRRVTMIVVTHHHPDHTGGVAACRERFGARVVGHRLLGERLPLDVAVKDGDWLPLTPGTTSWALQVLETPGHTRDSISLWHPQRRALFVGDLLQGGPGTVVIDPPDGDMRAYLGSLERCRALEPELLFPAHGSPQGAAVRRIEGMVKHRLAREAKVLEALAAPPATLEELVPRVYADTPQALWGWAERSLLAHLEKLEREGRAERAGEGWRMAGR